MLKDFLDMSNEICAVNEEAIINGITPQKIFLISYCIFKLLLGLQSHYFVEFDTMKNVYPMIVLGNVFIELFTAVKIPYHIPCFLFKSAVR